MRYKDFVKDVCKAYIMHSTSALSELKTAAINNDTPHWYSEVIAEIEESIVGVYKRFE